MSEDYEPLLSDFGFCSFMNESQARQSQLAYKSPESILYSQVSPKCDVFFLGIIILEILTRKFPSQYLHNEQGGTDLVQWIRSAIDEGREVDLLDPDLTSTTDFVQEMKRFLHIGAACTEDEPDRRLTLGEALSRIHSVNASDQETTTLHVHSMTREESIGQQSGHKSIVFQVS